VVVAALVIALVLALSGGGGYTVHAHFVSASQIVQGNEVRVSGKAVGSVQDVALTPDGQADITLSVEEDGYFPLRRGTRATVRLASLSGVANRYIDLQLGGADGADVPDGGRLGTDSTEPAVDLDQVFNTFDPLARRAVSNSVEFLRDFQAGQAAALGGIRSTPPDSKSNGHVLPQVIVAGDQSLPARKRTPDNRGNAYQPPGSRPDMISQALPSFDCKPSEKPPTSTPGCKIAGPIPFDNVEQFFPNVREGGPGGTPAGG